MSKRALALSALVGLAACSATPPRSASSGFVTPPWSIDYEVSVRTRVPSWVLDVSATYEGGIKSGFIQFPPSIFDVRVIEVGKEERSPELRGRFFSIDCNATCTLRYSFALSRAAEITSDAVSIAVRSDNNIIAPAASWLVQPEPLDARAKVTLRVQLPKLNIPGQDVMFAAPFPKDPQTGAYQFMARDLAAAGYTVFGVFTETTIQANRGVVQVVNLGNPIGTYEESHPAFTDGSVIQWVRAEAAALDTVYGHFPVDRATLVLVPVDGREVTFGRTVPAGGPSIIAFVGRFMGEKALRADWILAHEFFHLGVPSMPREGVWLDEGLATYYEPILRARAGLLAEQDAWADFIETMPLGTAKVGAKVLPLEDDHDRIYFGGSLFSLACDVEIRRRTNGEKSLDDGLRNALAEGGNATLVWRLSRYIDALDRGTGTTVVREFYNRLTLPPVDCKEKPLAKGEGGGIECAPDNLASMWRLFDALGAKRNASGAITLDDNAPLSDIRRDIGRLNETIARNNAPSNPGDAASNSNESEPKEPLAPL